MKLLVILWLASLSAGTAAVVGGRAAWRLRFRGRRTEYGIAWSLALWAYAIAQFATTYNAIVDGPRKQDVGYLAWQIIWSNLEAIGVWVIALTLINGRQGFVRRRLSALLERLEGKEIEMVTDEHDDKDKPSPPSAPKPPPQPAPPSPQDDPPPSDPGVPEGPGKGSQGGGG